MVQLASGGIKISNCPLDGAALLCGGKLYTSLTGIKIALNMIRLMACI